MGLLYAQNQQNQSLVYVNIFRTLITHVMHVIKRFYALIDKFIMYLTLIISDCEGMRFVHEKDLWKGKNQFAIVALR